MNPLPNLLTHSIYWELPILIVVVSLVYSATRFDRWDYILHEALLWGMRMGLFLAGIVLILAGLSMDDMASAMRIGLSGAGIVIEISLLFTK